MGEARGFGDPLHSKVRFQGVKRLVEKWKRAAPDLDEPRASHSEEPRVELKL